MVNTFLSFWSHSKNESVLECNFAQINVKNILDFAWRTDSPAPEQNYDSTSAIAIKL